MDLAHILAALPERPADMPQQQHLYSLLKQAMLDGVLLPGQRLPASRQLATEYQVARNSVLYAYQQLLAEGFVVADRRGTRVAALPELMHSAPAVRTVVPSGKLLAERAGRLGKRADDSVLPFAPGVPDVNAMPWATWARYLQKAWGEVSARQLAYAAPGGEWSLRQSVAGFLRSRRGLACTPEQVFIVGGAQLAIDACARLLADPGERVWLENPGYQAARSAMLAAGLEIVGVPVDSHGMAPDDVLWRQQSPRLVCLTPAHQYPLGSVLSLDRRLEFLRRIRPGEGWIVEDDYDSEFNHARPGYHPLPAMQGLVADAPVVYVGTFSKMLYPGLRLAYMVVPRWAVKAFGDGLACLYQAGQAVEQRALARFIENGHLTRHLRRMGPLYTRRQAILRQELQTAFGREAGIIGGDAGLHLCLLLPGGSRDVAVVDQASRLGISTRALSSYYLAGVGSNAQNGLLLGYGMADEQRIPELVRRLRTAYDKALDAPHNPPSE